MVCLAFLAIPLLVDVSFCTISNVTQILNIFKTGEK